MNWFICSHCVGAEQGWPPKRDVCERPDFNLPNGHNDYCKKCGPCGFGEGDCDGDAQCRVGLTCVQNIGAKYCWKSNYDVCEYGSSRQIVNGNQAGSEVASPFWYVWPAITAMYI